MAERPQLFCRPRHASRALDRTPHLRRRGLRAVNARRRSSDAASQRLLRAQHSRYTTRTSIPC